MRMNRRSALLAGGAVLLAPHFAKAETIPSKPEPGPIKLGSSPWIGGGMWEIAARKGLFTAEGLEKVEIQNFTLDTDMNSAFASGELQAGVLATHTAMKFVESGIPIRVVLLMDVSTTADAIITDGEVASIPELKGRQVAYEEGSTSDILLNYALAQHGMTIADVEKVPMPAADAGSALIAGRVPVAITYEPYLSVAKAQNPKVKMIFDAGANRGLISDVLAVSETMATEKPGQVAALIRAWDKALVEYNANLAESRATIAKAVGSTPEDLETAFDGVVYYSVAENREALAGSFLKDVIPQVDAAAQKAKFLDGSVDMSTAIDAKFLGAAS